MANDLATRFFEVLYSGYEPDEGIEGVCQFVLRGDPGTTFHIDAGTSLTFHAGAHPSPRTMVSVPETILEKLLGEGVVDFRNPEIMQHIEIGGDERLATLLGNLLKQPDTTVAERLEAAEKLARASARVTEVERVERPSEAYILAAIEAGRPIVARNMLNHWKVLDWKLADWKREWGNIVLRVKSAKERESLADIIDAMTAADRSSARYSNGVVLPEQLQKFFKPPYFEGRDDAFSAAQIWMGTASHDEPATHLHRDGGTGFLGHVFGKKRFLLYSPDQAPYLYPFKRYNGFQPCWVRPLAPNLAMYPLFKEARGLEVTLEPGDLLINPTGWFHEVYADEPVISVSYFLN
jgi:hypothetical protein